MMFRPVAQIEDGRLPIDAGANLIQTLIENVHQMY